MKLPRYVEVETSRFCNRRCVWCPNHLFEKRQIQELMDWSIFQSIVYSLSRRDYSGWLAFHNYNEPLANPRIIDEVAFARKYLAHAGLTIFTNGDYLTTEMFDDLCAAGLTQMRVTIYPGNCRDNVSSHDRLWRWLHKRDFLRNREWNETVLRQGPALVLKDPVAIDLISPDVNRYYDRGGTLPSLSIQNRASPCFLTSNSLSIDHCGNIKMCCNIVTGHAPHETYLFANVGECDPIETWNSARFAEVRRLHERSDWSATPICSTCRQEIVKA